MERTLVVSVDGPKHMEGYGLEGDVEKKDLLGIADLLQAWANSNEKLQLLGKGEGLVLLRVNRLAAKKPLEELKRLQEIRKERKLTGDELLDRWEAWERLMDEIICIL